MLFLLDKKLKFTLKKKKRGGLVLEFLKNGMCT